MRMCLCAKGQSTFKDKGRNTGLLECNHAKFISNTFQFIRKNNGISWRKNYQTTRGTESTINGKKQRCYPYIKMLSPDDGDNIISFYKERLKGYKYMDTFGGMIRVFWKGADEFNPLDMDQRCRMVTVQIFDGKNFKALMPKATSVIELTYTP